LIGCFLAPFLCAIQSDLKSIAAYSSISHINFSLIVLERKSLLSGGFRLSLFLLHGFIASTFFFIIG